MTRPGSPNNRPPQEGMLWNEAIPFAVGSATELQLDCLVDAAKCGERVADAVDWDELALSFERAMRKPGSVVPVKKPPPPKAFWSGRSGLKFMLAAAAGVSIVAAALSGWTSDEIVHSDCLWLKDEDAPLRVATWWNAPEYPPIRVKRDGCGAVEAQAAAGLRAGEVECGNEPMILQRVQSVSFKDEAGQCQTVDEKTAVMTVLEQQAKDVVEKGGPRLADLAVTNLGADLDRLVCDARQPALEPLGRWDDPKLRFLTDRIPGFLRDLVTCPDGKLYGAVLGLHQLNTMLFNKPALGGDSIVSARDIVAGRDILQLAEDTKNRGMERPIVVVDEGSMWSLFVVEDLMVARVGSERYLEFWRQLYPPERGDRAQYTGFVAQVNSDAPALDMTPLEDALDAALALVPYMQTVDTRDEAASAISGDEPAGAITVVGDWVVPELDPNIVGRAPFPGTEQYYVFNGDMISVARSDEQFSFGDPAMGVMKAMTSPKLLSRYSPTKHSVSVVTTHDGKAVAKTEREIFRNEQGNSREGVPGLPALIPSKPLESLQGDITALMHQAIEGYFDEGKDPRWNTDVQEMMDDVVNGIHHESCIVLQSRNVYPSDCPPPPKAKGKQ